MQLSRSLLDNQKQTNRTGSKLRRGPTEHRPLEQAVEFSNGWIKGAYDENVQKGLAMPKIAFERVANEWHDEKQNVAHLKAVSGDAEARDWEEE